MKTPDLHYYGPPQRRGMSREARRNLSQTWNIPPGPNAIPQLRVDDEIEHPVTVRRISPSEIARLRKDAP